MKYLASALFALTLAVGGWGYWNSVKLAQAVSKAQEYQRTIQAQKTALKASEARSRALSASLAQRLRDEQALKNRLKESQDALSKALAADPGWAAQPVPPAVLDWLREH